jgi:hypothetical protein
LSNGTVESVLHHADAAAIDSVEDARSWAIEHDTRVDSLWVQQVSTNVAVQEAQKELGAEQKAINGRLNKLELRIVWLAGVAAGLGSALPQIIKYLL